MTKHLGRNPFRKKKGARSIITNKEDSAQASSSPRKHTAEWLFVDLPAGSFMFALKTVLLVKGVFEKSPKA